MSSFTELYGDKIEVGDVCTTWSTHLSVMGEVSLKYQMENLKRRDYRGQDERIIFKHSTKLLKSLKSSIFNGKDSHILVISDFKVTINI